MYDDDLTRTLIVYLTHLATMMIPAAGMFSWLRGLFQASLVMALHGASEGKYSQLWRISYFGVLLGIVVLQVAKAAADIKT